MQTFDGTVLRGKVAEADTSRSEVAMSIDNVVFEVSIGSILIEV